MALAIGFARPGNVVNWPFFHRMTSVTAGPTNGAFSPSLQLPLSGHGSPPPLGGSIFRLRMASSPATRHCPSPGPAMAVLPGRSQGGRRSRGAGRRSRRLRFITARKRAPSSLRQLHHWLTSKVAAGPSPIRLSCPWYAFSMDMVTLPSASRFITTSPYLASRGCGPLVDNRVAKPDPLREGFIEGVQGRRQLTCNLTSSPLIWKV
mmetsp:Transcript_11604/g.31755  ORF Transcript_11604/g.31755 Transcript_11604/m.31755 type:complete len:206 (-) Transcript_11604:165-782(-)